MGYFTLSIFVVLAAIYGCNAEWCGNDLSLYCINSCCGTNTFPYCCFDNTDNTDNIDNTDIDLSYVSTSLSTGIIVAIVISCIIFVAIIVGIIICCVCCAKAAASTNTRTVYRAPAPTHVTMVTGHQNAGFSQPPAYPAQNSYPMQPPMAGYDSGVPPQNTGYPTQQYSFSTTPQKY